MKIIFIKDHFTGIKEGTIAKTHNMAGLKFIKEGYAEEVKETQEDKDDKELSKLIAEEKKEAKSKGNEVKKKD